MKKYISIILATLMFCGLCACGSEPAVETTPAPTPSATPEPTPTPIPTPTPTPEPEWEPGTVRVGPVGLVHSLANRGDELNAIGQWGDYYIVSQGEYELLVEAQFLRMESEEAFEVKVAYADGDTNVFASAYLSGEPVDTLSQNTELQVLDGKGDWLYVEWDEGKGYIAAENANDSPIRYRGGGGGGGGGGGADGGDITLGYLINEKPSLILLSAYVGPEYSAFDSCKATVLSDSTELCYCIFGYGDTVRVTAVGEESCTLFVGSDIFAEFPRNLIFMDGDAEYESWIGYTEDESMIYEDYRMRKLLAETELNDTVEVIDCIGDTCVVRYNDQIGYVSFESLSETQIVYRYSGGGGGGGDEWSAPVL